LFRLRINDAWTRVEEIQLFRKTDGLPTDYQLGLCVLGDSLVINTSAGPLLLEVNGSGKPMFTPLAPAGKPVKWLSGRPGELLVVDNHTVSLVKDNRLEDQWHLALVPGFENTVVLPNGDYLFCLENGFARRVHTSAPAAGRRKIGPGIRWMETADGEARYSATSPPVNPLPYAQNTVRFRFASPVFDRAPVYYWKLDGLTESWSEGQTEPEKEFSHLPEGNYVFRVRTGVDGPEASLAFRIAPPWYRSLGAWIVYLLMVAGLVFVVEKFNRRRLEMQREHLEEENRRELERQRAEAEREMLALEVDNKSKELSNAAFNLIRKNEVLQHLKDTLLETKNDPRVLSKIVREIDAHLESDHDWEIFESSFNAVHDDFFKRLMHDFPDMTPGDLRLAAYLKMNLSSKEIAPLLNISVRGVENKRYRLRRKLGLPEDANLAEFMINY
jgi:DNA-binding CsgD family transcriptional regulator